MGPMRCLMLRDILVPAKSVARVGKKGKSQVGASKSASASCVKSPPLMFFFWGGMSCRSFMIFLLLKFWTWRKNTPTVQLFVDQHFFLCHWSLSLGVQARYESINLCLPRWVFDGLWMIDASFHAQHRIDHLEDTCSLICLLDIHTRSY